MDFQIQCGEPVPRPEGISPEGMRERREVARNPQRRSKQRDSMRRRRAEHLRPFVGVDGEGGQTGPCEYHLRPSNQRHAELLGGPFTPCACLAFQQQTPKTKRQREKRKVKCVCGHRPTDHRHEYHLLRAGNRALETGQTLTSRQVFAFLADLEPDQLYQAYFMAYDVGHWCRDLYPYKLSRLNYRERRKILTPGWRTHYTVTVAFGACLSNAGNPACDCTALTINADRNQGECACGHKPERHDECYEIDYLPGHFFEIRRRQPGAKTVTISESGTFFQQSFAKTLTDWEIGTPEQRAQIVEGKEDRENFLRPDDTMRAYNALEIELLAELMTKFRQTMRECGLPAPPQWQGPGGLAGALLKQHSIPKAKTLRHCSDNNFKLAANWTYYGGWFETSAVGDVPDLLYDMDINSAYPYALTKVPCLEHGTWTEGPEPTSELFIAFGQFEAIEDACYYGLSFRTKDNRILRPKCGRGWYWSFEIEASIHQRFTWQQCRVNGRSIGTVWSYHHHCDCQPFAWVNDLYQQRLRLGKSVKGKALKLVLNSLYGKLSQRVGSPQYNNLVWSSFITAQCRTQVQQFLHSLPDCQQGGRRCGNSAPYIATDGLLTSELPREWKHPQGKPLGAWDHDPIKGVHRTGVFIMQPGLYFGSAIDEHGKRVTPKTRGIRRNLAHEYEKPIRDAFRKWLDTGNEDHMTVPVTMRNVYTLRLSMHLNRPDLIGQWDEHIRQLSFDWTSKRAVEPWPPSDKLDVLRELKSADEIEYLRTYPPNGVVRNISKPYSKETASFFDEQQMIASFDGAGQPDWIPYFGAPQEDI